MSPDSLFFIKKIISIKNHFSINRFYCKYEEILHIQHVFVISLFVNTFLAHEQAMNQSTGNFK